MDDRRFDAIARGFARGRSRRNLLQAAALGSLGWLGLRTRDAAAEPTEDNCQKTPGGHCTQHIECCDGMCDDLGHCPCGFGQSFCHGKCIDDAEFKTNPFHCGGCGKACLADGLCTDGICSRPKGTSECFGACVPEGDKRCECPEPCAEGCCPPDQTCCNGECVHLGYSGANCGACGVVCPEGTKCNEGKCVCAKPCGDSCCGHNQKCCNGDFCCWEYSTCCKGGCCATEGSTCCEDFCCWPGTECILGTCLGWPR